MSVSVMLMSTTDFSLDLLLIEIRDSRFDSSFFKTLEIKNR